jgi:hypothetical protein
VSTDSPRAPTLATYRRPLVPDADICKGKSSAVTCRCVPLSLPPPLSKWRLTQGDEATFAVFAGGTPPAPASTMFMFATIMY